MTKLHQLRARLQKLFCRIKVVFGINAFRWVEAALYGVCWGTLVGSALVVTLVPRTSDYWHELFVISNVVGCFASAVLFALYAVFRDRHLLDFLQTCLSEGKLEVSEVISVTSGGAVPSFPSKPLTIAVSRTPGQPRSFFEHGYHCAEPPNLSVRDRVLFCTHIASNKAVFVRSIHLCLLDSKRRQQIEESLRGCKNDSLRNLGFEKVEVLNRDQDHIHHD